MTAKKPRGTETEKAPRDRLMNLLVDHEPVNNPSAVRADHPAKPAEQGEHPNVDHPAPVQAEQVIEVVPVEPQPTPQVEQPQQPAPEPPAAKEPAPMPQQTSRPPRQSPIGGTITRMTNVSVPLEPELYLRLSLARVYKQKSAITILTEALDQWLIDNGYPPEEPQDPA